MNSSLVVVGTGIKFISHLTNEAQAYIKQSNKTLYLVNDPAMKQWIQKNNLNSESLDSLYTKYALRADCYNAITNYILKIIEQEKHVCLVFYGHPVMYAQPGLDAVIKAKQKGYYAKVLPGISAENCLYADLLLNPGINGCQSFEATDFLLYNRQYDPTSNLILWQIDILGVLTNPMSHDNSHGMRVLVNHLNKKYDLNHEVIIYEAAQYPFLEPKIQKLYLHDLPQAECSRISTLYIPPAYQASINQQMIHELNIKI